MPVRHKVFVSYHHGGDRESFDSFVRVFQDQYEVVHDHSVDRRIGSENNEYVIRRIRDNYLTGASVTIVLCGLNTYGRKYVDWEIYASLQQRMGLIGINLPTNVAAPDGRMAVPRRLCDNIQSGYALWLDWPSINEQPATLAACIEEALAKPRGLIANSRPKRRRNSAIRQSVRQGQVSSEGAPGREAH